MTLKPEETIALFLAHCHRRRYPAKSVIIRQGEPCADLHYLVEGSVSVLITDPQGRDLVLAYLNRGQFFGEVGLFQDGASRGAIVRSRAACEVAQISYEELRRLPDLFPELLVLITRQMSVRLTNMNRKLGDLTFIDAAGRIARTLLDLSAQPDAITHPEGMQIRITRQELARIVGCSREMVGKVIKTMEDQHLIEVHGQTVVIRGTR
jgi:CRP/FNR family cyclic AMP-dependent transcriptional regulator